MVFLSVGGKEQFEVIKCHCLLISTAVIWKCKYLLLRLPFPLYLKLKREMDPVPPQICDSSPGHFILHSRFDKGVTVWGKLSKQ